MRILSWASTRDVAHPLEVVDLALEAAHFLLVERVLLEGDLLGLLQAVVLLQHLLQVRLGAR